MHRTRSIYGAVCGETMLPKYVQTPKHKLRLANNSVESFFEHFSIQLNVLSHSIGDNIGFPNNYRLM